jgi:hypothetical protein
VSITLRQALMVGGRVLGRVDFGELAGRETSEMKEGGLCLVFTLVVYEIVCLRRRSQHVIGSLSNISCDNYRPISKLYVRDGN